MFIKKYRGLNYIIILSLLTLCVSLLFVFIFAILFKGALPLLEENSIFELLFSSLWNPEKSKFGLFPVVYGTILVTGVSLAFAVPVSILCALYITEYASLYVKRMFQPFLDILAGIPSVVYGLCSYVLLAPCVKDYVAPIFNINSTGLCIITASLTLAVMIFPIVIALTIEALRAVPLELRESALSLGATKWQMITSVLLRVSSSSIFSAVLLGFSRAFGETIAVNMVVGGIARVPLSLLDPGQTLASMLASSYGEMMSVPLYKSALLTIALILFVSVLFFNILARLLIYKTRYRTTHA